jgi:hypothetical protein
MYPSLRIINDYTGFYTLGDTNIGLCVPDAQQRLKLRGMIPYGANSNQTVMDTYGYRVTPSDAFKCAQVLKTRFVCCGVPTDDQSEAVDSKLVEKCVPRRLYHPPAPGQKAVYPDPDRLHFRRLKPMEELFLNALGIEIDSRYACTLHYWQELVAQRLQSPILRKCPPELCDLVAQYL